MHGREIPQVSVELRWRCEWCVWVRRTRRTNAKRTPDWKRDERRAGHPNMLSSPSMRAQRGHMVISPPSMRYVALHAAELEQRGWRAIGQRLWLSTGVDDDPSTLCSAQHFLRPLVRSPTLGELLEILASGDEVGLADEPWTLRYEDHGTSVHGSPRAHECLTAVARFLKGPPALFPGTCDAEVRDLVLIRSRRLFYLAESPKWCRERQGRDEAQHVAWSSRPYSFSAATDPVLARLAMSLALWAHQGRPLPSPSSAPRPPPTIFDPCCGSGTVLFVAASQGLPACGCDLNPLAVEGATRNLEHAADVLGWPMALRPLVVNHDCTAGPLPPGVLSVVAARDGSLSCTTTTSSSSFPEAAAHSSGAIVLASLPWGRQQRLSHAFHVHDILTALRTQLPGATFCCLSASSIRDTLAECGLTAGLEVEVAGGKNGAPRCVLSISRVAADAPIPTEAQPSGEVGAPGMGSAEAEAPVASDQQQEKTPLELLSGGGLKGEPINGGREPSPGDAVALQCRSELHGRVWVEARVEHVEPPSSEHGMEWHCRLSWTGSDSSSAWQPPPLAARVRLARHDGPNWRFADEKGGYS